MLSKDKDRQTRTTVANITYYRGGAILNMNFKKIRR